MYSMTGGDGPTKPKKTNKEKDPITPSTGGDGPEKPGDKD